jgi:hypothetical protein
MGWASQVASNLAREGFNAAFPAPRRGRSGNSGCLVFLVILAVAIAHLFE